MSKTDWVGEYNTKFLMQNHRYRDIAKWKIPSYESCIENNKLSSEAQLGSLFGYECAVELIKQAKQMVENERMLL